MEKCSGCGAFLHENQKESLSPGYLQNLNSYRMNWIKQWNSYLKFSIIPTESKRTETLLQSKYLNPNNFSPYDLERVLKRIKSDLNDLETENSIEQGKMNEQDEYLNEAANESNEQNEDCFDNGQFKNGLFLQKQETSHLSETEFGIQCSDELMKMPDAFICERCQQLKSNSLSTTKFNYRQWSATEINYIKTHITRPKRSIMCLVVDVVDFPHSLIANIDSLFDIPGLNIPVILVGNKIDLLCGNGCNQSDVHKWLISTAMSNGLKRPICTLLTSAKTGYGVEKLSRTLTSIGKSIDRSKSDIFFIGCVNVGKSMLWNALMSLHKITTSTATVSAFPGTTAGFLKVSMKRINSNAMGFLYDTPGIPREASQIISSKLKRFSVASTNLFTWSDLIKVESDCNVKVTVSYYSNLCIENNKPADFKLMKEIKCKTTQIALSSIGTVTIEAKQPTAMKIYAVHPDLMYCREEPLL